MDKLLYNKDVFELDVANCQPLLLASLVKNSEYQKDVENGVFYIRMAEKIGCSDKKFKLLSYRYIFFSNKPLKKGKIYGFIGQSTFG